MKAIKSIVLLVVGVVIGATGPSVLSAQRPQQQPQPVEIVSLGRTTSVDWPVFIKLLKDEGSGGCWLLVYATSKDIAVSPAPAEACKK